MRVLARVSLICAVFTALANSVGCTPSTAIDPSLHETEESARVFVRNPSLPAPIKAVATVGMVADVVRSVGGPHIEVKQLMGAGVDPHLYKANRDDVRDIMRGEIVFYSGLVLEGKMIDSLKKAGKRKPTCAIAEALDPKLVEHSSEFSGHPDPHVWMDVSLWSQATAEVARALSQFDPVHADEYQANANAYRAQLDALHAYGKAVIETIPKDRRVLVTSHDAFHYFGRAYGLEVLGVQGISTESEAGLQQINALVDMLVSRKIPAVFVESSVPRKSIETLIQGAASHGHNIIIGAELYSDAMGSEGSYEGTYLGMLDHNITQVTRALGGEAPATGFLGKLAASP